MLKWLAVLVVIVALAPLPAARAAGPSADNAQTSVKVTQLPTISIANPISIAKEKKSRLDYVFDWGPWAFSLLLFVVGALQVWLLFGTLRATRIAADAAVKAADAASGSAKAANDQIQLMISKERSRLSVRPLRINQNISTAKYLSENYGMKEFVIEITHYGPTNAFNVIGSYRLLITKSDSPPSIPIWHPITGIPLVIKTGCDPIRVTCFTTEPFTKENFNAIANKESFLHFVGGVFYDTLDKGQTTPFRFVLDADKFYGELQFEESCWVKCGPDSDNQPT